MSSSIFIKFNSPWSVKPFWPGHSLLQEDCLTSGLGWAFFSQYVSNTSLTSLGLSLTPCLHPGLGGLGGRHHAELSAGSWAQELGLTVVDKSCFPPESVPGPLGVIHFHNPLSSPTEALEHYFRLKVKGRMCQAGWTLLPDPKAWTLPLSHLCDSSGDWAVGLGHPLCEPAGLPCLSSGLREPAPKMLIPSPQGMGTKDQTALSFLASTPVHPDRD